MPDIGDVGGDRKAKLQNLEAEAEGKCDTKDTKRHLDMFNPQKEV